MDSGASEAKDEKSVVDLTIVIPMVDTAHEVSVVFISEISISNVHYFSESS